MDTTQVGEGDVGAGCVDYGGDNSVCCVVNDDDDDDDYNIRTGHHL